MADGLQADPLVEAAGEIIGNLTKYISDSQQHLVPFVDLVIENVKFLSPEQRTFALAWIKERAAMDDGVWGYLKWCDEQLERAEGQP
ncbi:hypothetical protein Q5692_40165 [Microcoleus sp. C2C3]|uniref:hypothetical protein n=1 Tax=Microcoleus sp. C2C3 TaxID=3055324 RepID=UPI002FD0C80D